MWVFGNFLVKCSSNFFLWTTILLTVLSISIDKVKVHKLLRKTKKISFLFNANLWYRHYSKVVTRYLKNVFTITYSAAFVSNIYFLNLLHNYFWKFDTESYSKFYLQNIIESILITIRVIHQHTNLSQITWFIRVFPSV